MDAVERADAGAARVASAIGEPARARMLYCLLDRHARTSTELTVIAGVSPSTASVHLERLRKERLVHMVVQGKHRYYQLAGEDVARVLEALSVVAGEAPGRFVPNTPHRLRLARTCYDHIAGTLGVALHDGLRAQGWLENAGGGRYEISTKGERAWAAWGVDVEALRSTRRRLAFACREWCERRSHLGGAAGAALLQVALRKRWVTQDPDSRALSVTSLGRREMESRFGIRI